MKKVFLCVVFLSLVSSLFAIKPELPEIKRDKDTIELAFQRLIFLIGGTGNIFSGWREGELYNPQEGIDNLDFLLSHDYETVRRYVLKLSAEYNFVINTGLLSQFAQDDLIKNMSSNWSLDEDNFSNIENRNEAFEQEITSKINNFQTWVDFFEGKNTLITDFMKYVGTKENLTEMIYYYIPVKDAERYNQRLTEYLSDWGL